MWKKHVSVLNNKERDQSVQYLIYLCADVSTESDYMCPSLYGLSIEEEIR